MTKTENEATYPFAEKRITKYVSAQMDLLKKEKSQKEIALEIGYQHANIVSMFKRGETRIPLDKIPALAKALYVDVRHLFRLAMEDYWPGHKNELKDILGTSVSANEYAIVEEIRRITDNEDVALTSKIKKGLEVVFQNAARIGSVGERS